MYLKLRSDGREVGETKIKVTLIDTSVLGQLNQRYTQRSRELTDNLEDGAGDVEVSLIAMSLLLAMKRPAGAKNLHDTSTRRNLRR